MSINSFSHYRYFRVFSLHSLTTRNNHQRLVQHLHFLCILLPFLGLSFRHLPKNLSNSNVLTANAPFFYQISGTWSNHEGSIFSWCWIPSFYGFLLCYRGRPQSHNVSKRRGYRETFLAPLSRTSLGIPFYLSNKKVGPSCTLPSEPLWILNFVREGNRTFDGPALFYAPLDPKMSFALLGAGLSRGSREGKRTNLLLHLARDEKERASSIDEQRLTELLALLSSSDPFVRNFFVRTEPLAESNPVPQDQLSAIHPPRIYAGAVASAMGFGLCRSKMMNRIVGTPLAANATGCRRKEWNACFALLDASDPII
ncbi:hypothetical protein IEQ34_024925 [Dendrobium chrysotoxum]|uniref:Uncharacterized protein n=1 Tax=Dendrobium chrysotoxum TaxID=161865 RepID=A0AAV7FJ78_DENCH|nr:hypothetical protein IEQ34_024925 [Dendrobium chrysotoxum]